MFRKFVAAAVTLASLAYMVEAQAWWVLWIYVGLAAVVFTVETAFLVVVAGKILRKRGLLEGELKGVVGFWLFVGYPCDILFNWWRGSWMFREWPRKWTFSSRIQWHIDNLAKSKEPMKALHWANVLNIDDGHIDNVPESGIAMLKRQAD